MADVGGFVEDVKKLVSDITDFLKNYTGTAEDKSKAVELEKKQNEKIAQILSNPSTTEADKKTLVDAQEEAKDAWDGAKTGDCNCDEKEENDTGNGPFVGLDYYSVKDFSCCAKKIQKVNDIVDEWMQKNDAIPKVVITAKTLSEVFGNKDIKRLEEIAKTINKYSDKFKIDTPLRMAYFLGQIGTETSFPAANKPPLTAMKESCSYSEETIKNGFGKEKIKYSGGFKLQQPGLFEGYTGNSIILAPVPEITFKAMAVKPKYIKSCELFDYVYCCGKKGLGNGDEASKDGSKFNGKGFIHLTGRGNYVTLTKYWNTAYPNNKKDFTSDVDISLLETDVETGIIASMVFWNNNNINDFADDDNIVKVTKLVNGSDNGLAKRTEFKEKAYEILKEK